MNLKWNTARLHNLEQLYSSGLSMQETADKLDTSIWAVNDAMRRYKIPRRTNFQTRKIQFLKSPLSYRKKEKLTPSEKSLHLAALMLYWAEGTKRGKRVDFANSDPNMVRIFINTLRQIYQINEKKLRALIYCHANQNITDTINFWSNITNIPPIQFSKPYIRQDFDINKSQKMPHGLIHIRYSDSRLLAQIKSEIDIISKGITLGYPSGQRGLTVNQLA